MSNWDTSNVKMTFGSGGMAGLFYGVSNFNQDISDWCVKDIESEPSNFDDGSPINGTNKVPQ